MTVVSSTVFFLFQVLPAAGTPKSCPARLTGVCAKWPALVRGTLLVWLSLWPGLVRRGITIGLKSIRRFVSLNCWEEMGAGQGHSLHGSE